MAVEFPPIDQNRSFLIATCLVMRIDLRKGESVLLLLMPIVLLFLLMMMMAVSRNQYKIVSIGF